MFKKIDHLAIAVKDLDKEIEIYKKLPGFEFQGTEIIEEQKVRVAFFKIGEVSIELLEPLSKDSPVSKFIEKRGGGLHHVAYETDNIEKEISFIQNSGIRMLDETPKSGAHNAKIAFVHPSGFSGVLVELKEKQS